MDPVSSPTASIWTTIGGNTPCRPSGLDRVSPCLTDCWTSMMAADTCALFTTSAVTSRLWRIGTPDLLRTPRTREKRARAVLWNSGPKMGTRSLMESHRIRPWGVLM